MKLKNILKQYSVTAPVLEATINNHASIWNDERFAMAKQISVQNGDLYMRQHYGNLKYGSWKCVAKVSIIRAELLNHPACART